MSAVIRPLLFVGRAVISFSVSSVSASSVSRAAKASCSKRHKTCVDSRLVRLTDDHAFALAGPSERLRRQIDTSIVGLCSQRGSRATSPSCVGSDRP